MGDFCMEVLGCKKMVGKPPHVQVLIPNSGSGQHCAMDSSKALLISYPNISMAFGWYKPIEYRVNLDFQLYSKLKDQFFFVASIYMVLTMKNHHLYTGEYFWNIFKAA